MKTPRSAVRHLTAMVPVAVLVALACLGCGGFSEEEATERCNQEQTARGLGGCFTLSTYDNCMAAYQECGEDTDILEECPVQYVCPE